VDIAGPQFGGEAVAFTIELQQRMITGGLEVAIVGTVFLPSINRDFRAVHIQHDPSSRIDSFGPCD
jgi:hypothetical protein